MKTRQFDSFIRELADIYEQVFNSSPKKAFYAKAKAFAFDHNLSIDLTEFQGFNPVEFCFVILQARRLHRSKIISWNLREYRWLKKLIASGGSSFLQAYKKRYITVALVAGHYNGPNFQEVSS